jgi:hypothetical protein
MPGGKMTTEYEFYGQFGITDNELSSRQRRFWGGFVNPDEKRSNMDLKRDFFAGELGINPATSTKSVADLELEYYASIGGTGTIDDMRQQFWSGTITPDPPDPPEEGLVARFSFNDPGNTETFDTVANRRMALTSFEKVAGYDGQAVNALGMSVGAVSTGLLPRNAFTLAVRQQITSVTATGNGGGVRLYAADGTTMVAQVLGRPQAVGSVNFACNALARFGGVNTVLNRTQDIALTGLSAGEWYWLVLIYDGATLASYVNDIQWNSVAAPVPPVDEAATSQLYTTGVGALIDDVRFFDYALDSTKRLELIGE